MEFFEARASEYLVPCTASQTETCRIVTKLQTWNKLLLGAGFEIQEEAETTNQLSVTNYTSRPQAVKNSDSRHLQRCAEMFDWLLTTHCCIGRVLIRLSTNMYTSFCLLHSICKNKQIKKLTIGDVNSSTMSTFANILPCLTNLEILELMTCRIDPVDYLEPVCALFQVSSSLRGLHIRNKITNEQTVGALLNAILRKPTLEELSFEDLALDTDTYIQTWKQYLSSTTVLKNLSLGTSNWSLQNAVLEGVLENESIEKLSLSMFKATEESVALVARIIKEKRAMRSLSIATSDVEHFELLSAYDCWVTPLIENDTLEEVMLCSCILRTARWSEFFRALMGKENLRTVHVSPVCDCTEMWALCAEITDSGADEKVSLDYDADLTFEAELLHCKAISMVWFEPWECDDHFIAALRLLPDYQHLKTLSVHIQNDHMRVSLALAEFLKSATALHTIRLHIKYFDLQETRDQNLWWNIILESICRSHSAKDLFLEMPDMSMQDSKDFAESVKHSRCMRKLCFMKSPKAINTLFFRHLSEGIQDNYTLASVTFEGGLEADGVSHWLAVKEKTWRNSGLVRRAARIKQASQFDRHVTTAVDRISRYPGLLDEVARRAKLDRAELEVFVRDRLRGIQSKDGFMRVVGVVKDRVICQPSDDGRMQLSDLNEDCWRYVRHYLIADDVQYDTCV